MNENMSTELSSISFLIGCGVFWHIQSVHGILWGLLYGFFWPVYVGYNLSVLLTH